MEKKTGRSVQTPLKSSGTEGKKVPDTTNNACKQFPRQSRRRELPGSKWEQNRKSFPQKQGNKTNNYDNKRPKPRGQLYQGCGKANTQVVDELAEELGLVATSPNGGSKKQSLNHLLNFHYAPRGEHAASSLRRPGSGLASSHQHHYNSAKWLMSTHKHKYNKEQFLQANCQFVVRSDGDYTGYLSDPDILVDWDMIEQVRVISCEDVNCPICLSTPVAGKITRCGHVFCWSCMLHYLALSDKSWRKCPICYESVHRQDLKSVEILLRATHNIGDQITFRLMKRERGSLIASPVSQYDARASYGLLSVAEDKLDVIYSKLLTADVDQISLIIEKETAELKLQISENEGCPELCFIEQAMQLLEERKATLAVRTSGNDNKDKVVQSCENSSACLKSSVSRSENSNDDCADYKGEELAFESNTVSQIDDSTVDDCNNHLVRSLSLNDGCTADDELSTAPSQFDFIWDSFNEISSPYDVGAEGLSCTSATSLGANSVTERHRYISASSTSEGEDYTIGTDHSTTITFEDLEIASAPSNMNTGTGKHFYFYQAEDGQELFLHAVNVRMLEMSYGSLENSPPLISGVILEKESGSMTEELRKRLRYLQHLPVTCQFEVAEIDLKPPVVTADTLEFFKDQLEIRKKRRIRRERDERRRERKMIEQVHRQFGRGPAPQLRIESLHHFPQCGSETATLSPSAIDASIPVETIQQNHTTTTTSSRRASSPVSISSGSPSSSSTGMSFAQMLREGKSSGIAYPSNPSHSLNTSGHPPTLYDSDNDAYPSTVPQYSKSFIEAITAKTALPVDKEEPESSSKRKKKRKQKVLLFATGMACHTK